MMEGQQLKRQTKRMPSSKFNVGASASRSLRCLIDEDPLLEELHLTRLQQKSTANTNEPAFAYAAALINADSYSADALWTSSDSTLGGNVQQKAKDALSEVDRKLVLVESLSERISREKPEHVAAPLLKLHGFDPFLNVQGAASSSKGTGVSPGLTSTLDRCDRLARQSQVLHSIANRVETTLERGLGRMNCATEKLERVLKTSQVLKMVMRLKFEAKKVLGSGLDFEALENASDGDDFQTAHVDLRDLTRAAASVAVIEELLNHEDLKNKGIDVVEQMRPEAERISRAVKRAAAGLLAEQHGESSVGSTTRLPSATKLGATLQVYYHLGELPSAAWNAVCLGLDRAEKANGKFLNPSAMKRLIESAKVEARAIVEKEVAATGGDKRQRELAYERFLKVKLREKKAEEASIWASGVAEAALQVFNLHRVLIRKSDPVTRQNFMEVVNAAPIPKKIYRSARVIQRCFEE